MFVTNAILIGAQKAGTTSIYNWLSQHPDILAPDWAKDNFALFSNNDLYDKIDESYGHILSERNNEKVVMTGNVNYLFLHFVAERIHEFDSQTKLICSLRNPVERAFSAYNYALERDIESRTFEDAISDELRLGDECYPTMWEKDQKCYIKHGMYHEQLSNYFRHFSGDQVFISFFEDLVNNNERLMKELLEFLEIDTSFKVDFFPKNVSRGSSRSKLINKLIYSNSVRQNPLLVGLRKIIPFKTRFKLRRALISVNAKKTSRGKLFPETKKKLVYIFEEDILRLQDLLKRDLRHWIKLSQ